MTARSSSPQVDETAISEYFQKACLLFDHAATASGGVRERFYMVDAQPVRLRFAGPAFEPHITPALEHVDCPPSPSPGLTVLLWDRASTGVALPDPPWPENAYVVRGEIDGLRNERIQIAISPGFRGLSLFDTAKNIAIFHVPDAARIPYYESSSPLRTIFHWWLARRGRQLAHAGAVGVQGRGVLLAGKGGSGKSVSCLTCLCAGMEYAGDDYTVLNLDSRPVVSSLYSSAKVHPHDLPRFPELGAAVADLTGSEQEKAVLFLQRARPELIARQLEVHAILLPRVVGSGRTTLHKVSAAAGLRSLAPSTIFQLPGAGRSAFEAISQFVKSTPSYVLEIGGDTAEIPAVIRDLLAG